MTVQDTKIKVETWHNVLILKEFTMQHFLSLIGPNARKRQAVKDEIKQLIEDGYLTKEGKLYKLTSDMGKRLYLLALMRESQKEIWREENDRIVFAGR